MLPRYPIYVPSKGRWQEGRATTVRAFARDQVPIRLVVEPSQVKEYAPWESPTTKLLVLPEDDFGLLRARNWIRDHAEAEGHAWHWQVDDNILTFYRFWEGWRIPCNSGVALRVCEDFADRFSTVGIAGLNYEKFVHQLGAGKVPFFRNVHVYSCTLVNHAMPYRWRLAYNDDTDLCLQALTNGWATLLMNAFMAGKLPTMTVGGGNTDDLYRGAEDVDAGDTYGRYVMARTLERAWPGTVKLTRRFGRYQHSVNWQAFRDVPLRLRDGVDLAALPDVDEYGLELRTLREPRSDRVRALPAGYPEALAEVIAGGVPDPLWRGLPAFRAAVIPPKLTVMFHSDEDRERLVAELGVTVDKRFKAKAWSAWWPPRGRNDPAALRFDISREK